MITRTELIHEALREHIRRLIRTAPVGMPTTPLRELTRINGSPITHVWLDSNDPDYYEED